MVSDAPNVSWRPTSVATSPLTPQHLQLIDHNELDNISIKGCMPLGMQCGQKVCLCLCCFENRTFLHCHRPWQPDTTLIPDRLGWRQKTPLLNYLGKFRRVWYTNLSCSELEQSARLKNLARINMKPSVRRHLQSWTDEEIPQGRDDNGANCLATQSRIHRQLQLWHRPFVSRETKSARQQPHNVYLVDKWDNPTIPIVRITWTLQNRQFPLQFTKWI